MIFKCILALLTGSIGLTEDKHHDVQVTLSKIVRALWEGVTCDCTRTRARNLCNRISVPVGEG